MTNWLDNIHNNLQKTLDAKGLTTAELSVSAGLDRTMVQKIISGKNRNPRIETICKLATAMDLSVSELVGDPRSSMINTDALANAIKTMLELNHTTTAKLSIDTLSKTIALYYTKEPNVSKEYAKIMIDTARLISNP